MSREIITELQLFIRASWAGCYLMSVYDGIRILRKVFPHKGMWIAAEDLLYWIYNGLFLFYMIYRENSGEMRGYIILGVALGMTVYNRTVSPVLVKWISGVFICIRKKCEILKNRLKKQVKQLTIELHNYFTNKVGKNDGEKSG